MRKPAEIFLRALRKISPAAVLMWMRCGYGPLDISPSLNVEPVFAP